MLQQLRDANEYHCALEKLYSGWEEGSVWRCSKCIAMLDKHRSAIQTPGTTHSLVKKEGNTARSAITEIVKVKTLNSTRAP